jgi:23S rRNA (cytosine1962-C5)-methyltransferase
MDMLVEAARDSGRRLVLERVLGQGADHPEVLTIPESSYLKGALLRAE